jgi:hypothetical protein
MTENGRKLLGIYLNDHYLGASAGVALAKRIARTHSVGTADLHAVSADIQEDFGELVTIMRSLGVAPSKMRAVAGTAAERIARLKLNGHLLTRSPLSNVIELEGLRTGVEGKKSGWLALRSLTDSYAQLDAARLDRLIVRAQAQADVLERLRLGAVAATFITDNPAPAVRAPSPPKAPGTT